MALITYLQSKKIPQDRPALIEAESDRTISYAELWAQVNQLTLGLRRLGFQSNERVALALPNSITWAVSFLAVLKAGGVIIPLSQFATPLELKRLLTHCKPSLLIGDSSFVNRSLPFDLLEENKGEQVVICSKRFMSRVSARRVNRLNNLLGRPYGEGQIITCPPPPLPQDIVSINYTYRGYGYPLGAMLTQLNYTHGIEGCVHAFELRPDQRCLLMLPLSHVYSLIGSLLTPLAIGSTVIIVRNPTTYNFWTAVSRYRPNVLTGVPCLYASFLRSENSLVDDLRYVEEAICGGSLMSIPLYEAVLHRWHLPLRQGYGLTECLPAVINPSRGNRPETLGKAGLGVTVRIFGEDGKEKVPGEVGEITIGGPTVMAGYYAMPRDTAEVLRNGWFYTGDYGWLDNEGYLHFSGVKKRIAKVAGHTVDLTEVEREILAYPGVVNARIYTVPDEKWGTVVCADITNGGYKVKKEAILRYLKKRLTSYKIPRIRVATE